MHTKTSLKICKRLRHSVDMVDQFPPANKKYISCLANVIFGIILLKVPPFCEQRRNRAIRFPRKTARFR